MRSGNICGAQASYSKAHFTPELGIRDPQGLTRRYVMRVLRLSFLAPDLIEAILTGRQPPDLTLEPFRRPIPLEWAAQRKFFGCIPSSRL